MVDHVLYSSRSEEWETPQSIFDRLNKVFSFTLDVCATRDNKKCQQFFSKQDDGLKQPWHDHRTIWMNPPYGHVIEQWMEKAYTESCKGCVVVSLVPARTDTKWWHSWVDGKAQVTFVKGRLKFGGSKNGAPFPSALVVYGLDVNRIVNGAGRE